MEEVHQATMTQVMNQMLEAQPQLQLQFSCFVLECWTHLAYVLNLIGRAQPASISDHFCLPDHLN